MKRKGLFSEQGAVEEVNISPLIDIVFILLIFFIVTAVFTKENSVEVDRPEALSSSEVEAGTITIGVDREGKVYYDGREIGLRGVQPLVKREVRRKERPVLVLIDKKASVEFYTKVHDQAAMAGAKTISMATQK